MTKAALWFSSFIAIVCTVGLWVVLSDQHRHSVQPEDMSVIEYDGCEYISVTRPSYYGVSVGLAHKGNCKYCTARR
jgi:hypothetical protein